eukprot:TRINITY_DN12652_c0_g1_i1.p2 TRINITY_DN12652_c0_g1~~TRINITY_DN12652_c0_g1_i1.p2  ORF type:complete len:103 (+),score=23.24 TRINITY_DN12652_c0_g1_i1:125-433(+)
MAGKCHQMALLVALFFVCATAELPSEDDHLVVNLESLDFVPEVQVHPEEDLRQRRAAVEKPRIRKKMESVPEERENILKGKRKVSKILKENKKLLMEKEKGR